MNNQLNVFLIISYLPFCNSEMVGQRKKKKKKERNVYIDLDMCCSASRNVHSDLQSEKYPHNALHGPDASCVLFTVSLLTRSACKVD